MDEVLLSSAPSYSSAVFFQVHPSIFIPSLYLLLLWLLRLPFTHNHLSHFICGTNFLLLCCLIFHHILYDTLSLSRGLPFPQCSRMNFATKVLHNTETYVCSNGFFLRCITSGYIRYSQSKLKQRRLS